MNEKDLYKRLARAEAMAAKENAELIETLRDAYDRACADQDEKSAAEFCRKIRNKLLADTDAFMSFDRMGLEVPTGTSFTSWLRFLQTLGNVLKNNMAKYRKDLRDVPEQAGFPFNVIWPEKPET